MVQLGSGATNADGVSSNGSTVVGIREVHDAVVNERRSLLNADPERTRPHEPETLNIAPIDLVERALAPETLGPAPGRPVFRRRILEHRIGDRHELTLLCARSQNPKGNNAQREKTLIHTLHHLHQFQIP